MRRNLVVGFKITPSMFCSGMGMAYRLMFSGSVPAADAGRTVVIERLGHETGWTWASTVSATVAHDGTFTAIWRTDHIGRFSIRVIVAGDARTAVTAPTITVTVYRPSRATLYGPGFYGRRTACGNRLGPKTIGVANRTLKCGAKVAVYYERGTHQTRSGGAFPGLNWPAQIIVVP